MALQASLHKKTFHFDFNARTSRGPMRERDSWFIKIWEENAPDRYGVGECAPLPGLSIDHYAEFEEIIRDKLNVIVGQPVLSTSDLEAINTFLTKIYGDDFLIKYPAFHFGLEMALLDLLNGGNRILFKNSFSEGEPLPINGLVWMGGMDYMLQQVEIKIRDGFRCIKLKVGGINFERECDILQYIRRKYYRDKVELRLDANGAFKEDDATYKLKELSRFDIHSIEQPIKPRSDYMAELIKVSSIPIALDEELIGVFGQEEKGKLLDDLKPPYIILKPTILGGFNETKEWADLANKRNIGWWLTSALESNVGLNAIAQFAVGLGIQMPQGLGTGMIYSDNFQSPLHLKEGKLAYNARLPWEIDFTKFFS